jgi:serine protease Do
MPHAARIAIGTACLIVALPIAARGQTPPSSTNLLRDMDTAIQTLTTRVSTSVVQVLVTGYRAVGDAGRSDTGLVIGRQRSLGSGAIIDADGYIVTNAHVVAGAQQVRVVLHGGASAGGGPLESLAADEGVTVPATIVGVAKDIDLALLKVDRKGLRALPLADYSATRQGELVFAFGSPDGLRNSVTMGVVSSAARQVDPDSSSVYIQTDAPINPGNSGGPLVNVKGELVGLNTFILSESGGSQGLGFAIPSVVIASAYPQLKKFGHVHRGMIGVNLQAITPALAEGLKLPRSSGVLVSDVGPALPADVAGVQVGDVIVSMDGKPIDAVPVLTLALNTKAAGDVVTLEVLRGSRRLSVRVPVAEPPGRIDRLGDLSDFAKSGVSKLGILGVDLDDTTGSLVSGLRIPSGVLVTARRAESDVDNPLMTGDVIHACNTITVRSLDGLRVLLDGVAPGSQLVLQIEREGRLMYVTMATY